MKVAESFKRVSDFIGERLVFRMLFILLVSFFVIGSIILVSILLVSSSIRNTEIEALQAKGRWLTQSLSEKGRTGVMVGNPSLLEKTAELTADDPEVLYLVFYTQSTREVYHLGESFDDFEGNFPPLPGATAEISSLEISSTNDSDVLALDVCRPILVKMNMGVGDPSMNLVGWVRIGISTERVQSIIGNIRMIVYVVLFLLVFLGAAIILFMHLVIVRPIISMSHAAKKIESGNLLARVDVSSNDEIGFLAGAFNDMAGSISRQLSHTNFLLKNLSETIELITKTSSEIYSISAQQSSGATEQAASVYQVSSTSKEIAASATRIAETSEEMAGQARATSTASEQGRVKLGEAVFQVKDATEKVEEVARRIVQLGEKSQKISGIIDIINEISEHTNLLSLNAAIEASGAGEAGRRFQVVAQEIRRLAGRTMDATKVVRSLIEEIQSATNTTVMVTEQGMKSTKEAAEIIDGMNESFHNILELVEQTLKASTEITLSTRQQTTACEQMVATIMEVSEVASEVEKGAKETEKSVSRLIELSDLLNNISKSVSTEEDQPS